MTGLQLAAAACAALAVMLLMPVGPTRRLSGLAGPDPGAGQAEAPDQRSPILTRLVRAHQSRRRRATEREQALTAIGALAAELRAGQPPSAALVNAAGTSAVWPSAIAAVRLDGDVAEALRVDALEHPILRSLAACWEVGAASGSGLAASVDRLASSCRAAEEIRGRLDVEMAGPRATARMLATLPLIGIGLGILMGADPVSWLLGSSIGFGCLGAGALLTLLGFIWTSRISAAVEARL